MQLLNTKDATEYEIYDITYDNTGYPHFLIYKDKQWMRVSAQNFTPSYEKVFYHGRDAYLVDKELIQSETQVST